jgi:hypothetical protein
MTCRLGSMIETRATHHVIGLHQAVLESAGLPVRTILPMHLEETTTDVVRMATVVIFHVAPED